MRSASCSAERGWESEQLAVESIMNILTLFVFHFLHERFRSKVSYRVFGLRSAAAQDIGVLSATIGRADMVIIRSARTDMTIQNNASTTTAKQRFRRNMY
jgi:hypothetical protein